MSAEGRGRRQQAGRPHERTRLVFCFSFYFLSLCGFSCPFVRVTCVRLRGCICIAVLVVCVCVCVYAHVRSAATVFASSSFDPQAQTQTHSDATGAGAEAQTSNTAAQGHRCMVKYMEEAVLRMRVPVAVLCTTLPTKNMAAAALAQGCQPRPLLPQRQLAMIASALRSHD